MTDSIATPGNDDLRLVLQDNSHLPLPDVKRSECSDCDGTGMRDSGGTQPWGEAVFVPCDCEPDDENASGERT